MDFYGVESGYILTLIDLDSGVYEPVFLKSRAAEGVAQALLDNVICRYGVPLEVRSDDRPPLASDWVQDIVYAWAPP